MSDYVNRLDTIYQQFIGRTPMIEIPTTIGARVFAKAEWYNLSGSIKDRAAYAMLRQALVSRSNDLNVKILEYSGGNLARSLAYLCRAINIKLTLVLPDFVGECLVNECIH